MSSRFYLGLLPWLVFAIVDRGSGHGVFWAGALAAGTTAGVMAWQAGSASATQLNWRALALFVGLAGLEGSVAGDTFGSFGRASAAGGLMLIALVSLLDNTIVAPYTRDLVVRTDLDSRRYRNANRDVTLIWAATFAAATASFVLAAILGTRTAATAFNWFVPGILVAAAVRMCTARWEQDFDPDEMMGAAGDWDLWL